MRSRRGLGVARPRPAVAAVAAVRPGGGGGNPYRRSHERIVGTGMPRTSETAAIDTPRAANSSSISSSGMPAMVAGMWTPDAWIPTQETYADSASLASQSCMACATLSESPPGLGQKEGWTRVQASSCSSESPCSRSCWLRAAAATTRRPPPRGRRVRGLDARLRPLHDCSPSPRSFGQPRPSPTSLTAVGEAGLAETLSGDGPFYGLRPHRRRVRRPAPPREHWARC